MSLLLFLMAALAITTLNCSEGHPAGSISSKNLDLAIRKPDATVATYHKLGHMVNRLAAHVAKHGTDSLSGRDQVMWNAVHQGLLAAVRNRSGVNVHGIFCGSLPLRPIDGSDGFMRTCVDRTVLSKSTTVGTPDEGLSPTMRSEEEEAVDIFIFPVKDESYYACIALNQANSMCPPLCCYTQFISSSFCEPPYFCFR